MDFKPWIQKSQLPEAIGQDFKLKFGGDGKNGRIRFEGDQGSRMLAATNDFQLLSGMAPCKLHEMDLLISRDLHFEPIGKGIDTFGSDSVKPSRIFVSSLPELTTGVQIGQNQLNGRHLEFGVHVHRDTSTIVTDGHRPIDVDGYLNFGAKTGQMFVNGIVQNFENTMMQSSFIRVTDIHARALSDRFKAFQFIDF